MLVEDNFIRTITLLKRTKAQIKKHLENFRLQGEGEAHLQAVGNYLDYLMELDRAIDKLTYKPD